jgi:hypothetical protein
MFEPFLGWLFDHIEDFSETWWPDLPRTVDLPHTKFWLDNYSPETLEVPA